MGVLRLLLLCAHPWGHVHAGAASQSWLALDAGADEGAAWGGGLQLDEGPAGKGEPGAGCCCYCCSVLLWTSCVARPSPG